VVATNHRQIQRDLKMYKGDDHKMKDPELQIDVLHVKGLVEIVFVDTYLERASNPGLQVDVAHVKGLVACVDM